MKARIIILNTTIDNQRKEISRLEQVLKVTRGILENSMKEVEYQKRRADKYKEKLDEKAKE